MDHTRLYIIRHGQVVGYETLRFNGQTDVGLTPLGAAQLEAVAEDLKDASLDAVYSSDLYRARYGGEALAGRHNVELRLEPAFREMHFGDWERMTLDEIEEKFPGQLEARRKDIVTYKPPNGESVGEVWDRVKARMDILLEEHQGQTVALVAHSGVNRAIVLQALGCPPETMWRLHQDFGCLNIIDYYPDADALPLIRLANGPNRVQGQEVKGA